MPSAKLNNLSASLVLLNLVTLSDQELARLKYTLTAIQTDSLWTEWLDLVQLNACESLIYLNLVKWNLEIPDSIQAQLKSVFDKVAKQNALRNEEAKRIFSQLSSAHIPFVVLKGQALTEFLYNSPYYKKMNDVDFLVPKSSLDQLQKLYIRLNLECAASIGGRNYRKQENFSHHWPPFFTRNLNCVLGTHWNLVTPLSKIKIQEQNLWQNTVPHSYLGIPCFRLNDLYFFFHLTVHLAYYKTGLKELCDPLNWYRLKHANIDYQKFLDLVQQCHAYDPVYRNLYLMNCVFPEATLHKWIQALEPNVSSFVVQDTQFRCREPYYVVRSRSTQTSRIEKSYALFSLSDMFYEKFYFLLKMWTHFLLPKQRDVIHMQSLDDLPGRFTLLLGYIKTPYLLSRVFAFDLGWKLHFLLIAKHHYDLLKSIAYFILGVFSSGRIVSIPQTLPQKIKTLNLPIDSIEQIKDKLE